MRERLVESAELAPEELQRPAVGRDVVEGREQQVPVATDAQQGDPERPIALQVEEPPFLGVHPAADLGLALAFSEPRQVDHRQRQPVVRVDPLHGPAVAEPEAGAQGPVAADDLAQRRRQDADLEGSPQAQGKRQVVPGNGRLEPGQEPQPPLGEGQRQVAVAGRGRDPRRSRLVPAAGGEQARRQLRDGRLFEQPAERNLRPEDLPQP